MRALSILGLLLVSLTGHAAPLSPAAQRGEAFFHQRFAISNKMPACTACHTENPLKPGQHAITGKAIQPLAVAANS